MRRRDFFTRLVAIPIAAMMGVRAVVHRVPKLRFADPRYRFNFTGFKSVQVSPKGQFLYRPLKAGRYDSNKPFRNV